MKPELGKQKNPMAMPLAKPMTNDQYLLQVMTDRCRSLEDNLLAMVQKIAQLEMEKGGLNAKTGNDNSKDKD